MVIKEDFTAENDGTHKVRNVFIGNTMTTLQNTGHRKLLSVFNVNFYFYTVNYCLD